MSSSVARPRDGVPTFAVPPGKHHIVSIAELAETRTNPLSTDFQRLARMNGYVAYIQNREYVERTLESAYADVSTFRIQASIPVGGVDLNPLMANSRELQKTVLANLDTLLASEPSKTATDALNEVKVRLRRLDVSGEDERRKQDIDRVAQNLDDSRGKLVDACMWVARAHYFQQFSKSAGLPENRVMPSTALQGIAPIRTPPDIPEGSEPSVLFIGPKYCGKSSLTLAMLSRPLRIKPISNVGIMTHYISKELPDKTVRRMVIMDCSLTTFTATLNWHLTTASIYMLCWDASKPNGYQDCLKWLDSVTVPGKRKPCVFMPCKVDLAEEKQLSASRLIARERNWAYWETSVERDIGVEGLTDLLWLLGRFVANPSS